MGAVEMFQFCIMTNLSRSMSKIHETMVNLCMVVFPIGILASFYSKKTGFVDINDFKNESNETYIFGPR